MSGNERAKNQGMLLKSMNFSHVKRHEFGSTLKQKGSHFVITFRYQSLMAGSVTCAQRVPWPGIPKIGSTPPELFPRNRVEVKPAIEQLSEFSCHPVSGD